jgi:hypothetical protein
MAEHQLPKLTVGVRFPSPAPIAIATDLSQLADAIRTIGPRATRPRQAAKPSPSSNVIRVRSIPLSVVITTVTPSGKPNLAVGLITTRDSGDRPAEEGIGILPYVAELTAIIVNAGDAVADETITRFWLRGADVDRELRVVSTPAVWPGEEIEVTALWDVRDGPGSYTITVTADAFSQIDEVRKDNNSATAHVTVRGTRVQLA